MGTQSKDIVSDLEVNNMVKKFSLTDDDLMPYGMYDDKKLKDVESEYLQYTYENHDIKRYNGLKLYIKDRLEKDAKQ